MGEIDTYGFQGFEFENSGGFESSGFEDPPDSPGAPPSHGLEEPDTLEPTWWVMDREPGMDDLAEGATEILKKMGDDLKIFPFQDKDGNDRLFLMRYEFVKDGESSQFPEAIKGESVGFLDFLAGFPIDCVEKLVLIGEYSTKSDQVTVKDGAGKAAAPVPSKFFQWPDADKILLNLTAIATKDVAQILAPNLNGEPKPARTHWFFRCQLAGGDKKWPILGEFLGLGTCLMPDVSWGHQLSSPFVYSGNWFDSVYLTGGVIKEVIDPTDDVPYSTFVATWRGKDIENVKPSDFCEYHVGDRCSILKDVSTEKQSQLWRDDDTKPDCDKSTWQIVPISYYGGI